ncbi:MAG: hypothetical protein K6T65_10420 [Peptococcaceae bacterium]|nr:hypothetical protein [Peptococcaceae bacterium]
MFRKLAVLVVLTLFVFAAVPAFAIPEVRDMFAASVVFEKNDLGPLRYCPVNAYDDNYVTVPVYFVAGDERTATQFRYHRFTRYMPIVVELTTNKAYVELPAYMDGTGKEVIGSRVHVKYTAAANVSSDAAYVPLADVLAGSVFFWLAE